MHSDYPKLRKEKFSINVLQTRKQTDQDFCLVFVLLVELYKISLILKPIDLYLPEQII